MSDEEDMESKHLKPIKELRQAALVLERNGRRIGSRSRILTDGEGDPLLAFSAKLQWMPKKPKVQWYSLQEEVLAVIYLHSAGKYSKKDLKHLAQLCAETHAALVAFLPAETSTEQGKLLN